MESTKMLYFAVCFSIVATTFLFLTGLNLWGITHAHSVWCFSKRRIVNFLWVALFLPGGIASGFVAVVFWIGVF